MEPDHRVGDLVRQLVRHLQNHSSSPPSDPNPNPNPNPNPEAVNYAIRILCSRMTPSLASAADDEAAIANSIKSRLAKQAKLSDALTFADLYSKFSSITGPGSVKNKQSLLYFLKVVSEDQVRSPNPSIHTDRTVSHPNPSIRAEFSHDYSSSRLKNAGVRNPNPKFEANRTLSDKTMLSGAEISDGYSSSRLKNGGVLTLVRSPDNVHNTAFRDFAMLVSEESGVLEKDFVTDVLSVCQGIDGRYVKFDDSVDSYVLSESVKVSKSSRVMVRKLCELGWLFRKVNGYVCEDMGDKVGIVAKSFCVALQDELLEYHKLLMVLKSHSLNLSLRRLAVWFVEPMVKMRRMAVLVDSCKDLKGGALAGEIHLHTQHGDPLLHDFMKRLLLKVSSPVFEMVRSWVMEGDLQDLHSEFFVSEQSVKPEYLWREGYQISYLMLPSFISQSLANRVLRTGKSINFLKVCCEEHSWAESEPRRGHGYGETNALDTLVAEAEKRIDKLLMNAIFNKYKFKDHCLAIKRFILLGQGDFVQYLMEITGPVLSEPANSISKIHLSGLLQKAILSSAAQYDDHDILDRIKVKMMPHGVKDKGWDVFCLDYDIRVPLNTVYTESVMGSYLRIFSFLWKIRRVEHAVLGAWKTMKPNLIGSYYFTKLPKAVGMQIVSTSRKCHVLWDEMNNFVTSLQAYIMFEVLEVTWSKFNNEMEAAKDLDDLIAAHEKYLVTIVERSLLGENSETLYKTLLMLFDVILRFTSVADRLYEFRTSNSPTKTKEAKTTKRQSTGLETDSWLKEGRKAVTQRAGEYLSILRQDLDAVSQEYSSILKGLISQLPTQHVDLKFLMFRLDCTEIYRLAT